MIREYTCIMCPQGCEISAECDENKEILSVSGNRCKKGFEYVRQELLSPVRNIASSVAVDGGSEILASVRLSNAISKSKIFDVMNEIKKARLHAPVRIGDIVIKDVLGLGADVIATRNVDLKRHK